MGGFIPGHGWNWKPLVLPYLAQSALYNQINFSDSAACASMEMIHRTSLPVLTCPSEADDLIQPNRTFPVTVCNNGPSLTSGSLLGAASSYAGSYGDGFNNTPSDPYGGDYGRENYGAGGCASNTTITTTTACPQPGSKYGGGPNHRGIFNYLGDTRPVRIADITDGTSNTLMMMHITRIATAQSNLWTASTGSAYGTSLPINNIFYLCRGTNGLGTVAIPSSDAMAQIGSTFRLRLGWDGDNRAITPAAYCRVSPMVQSDFFRRTSISLPTTRWEVAGSEVLGEY